MIKVNAPCEGKWCSFVAEISTEIPRLHGDSTTSSLLPPAPPLLPPWNVAKTLTFFSQEIRS
jgi:hypothetical protein